MMITHSVKISCIVFKVEVSVFADTVPSFFANRVLSTARIRSSRISPFWPPCVIPIRNGAARFFVVIGATMGLSCNPSGKKGKGRHPLRNYFSADHFARTIYNAPIPLPTGLSTATHIVNSSALGLGEIYPAVPSKCQQRA